MARHRFLLLALLLLFPALSLASVDKIVFTSEVQTVKPGDISQPLTIQLQDSSGSSTKTTETIDLEFLSTSSSGSFVGSTGNPATKTMSTNTSNRTFYYRDSSEGSFTLTVNATGRTSGAKWAASQNISISNSSTPLASPSGSDDDSSDEDSSSSTDTLSAYTSSARVTSGEDAVTLKIGAGRDRLASIGNPVEFKASHNVSNLSRTTIKWNFGDGSLAYGENVSHTYFFPGDYVVVVSISSPEGEAISRANVKVVPDALQISFVSRDRVEVYNAGKYEINLLGRELISGEKGFKFPENTIIKAGQKISFSSITTGLNPVGLGDVRLALTGQKLVAKPTQVDQVKIDSIVKEILALQRKREEIKANNLVLPINETATAILGVEESSPRSTEEAPRKGWFQNLKKFFGL